MDCEKFETTLIDELYDELDELTSAAAKRHVAGCARCASLLSGLKATRRLAVLPIVEPSADLEERILTAAKDAQKVVPIGRRFSGVVSWMGSWAMRPQTAMAAVFILMVGASGLFLRARHAPASSTMTITEQGAPASSVAATTAPEEERAALDPKAAAEAHGAKAPVVTLAVPPPAAAASGAPADLASNAYADDKDKGGNVRGAAIATATAPIGGVAKEVPALKSSPLAMDEAVNAAAPAGAPPARHYANPSPVAQTSDGVYGSAGGGTGGSAGPASTSAAQQSGQKADLEKKKELRRDIAASPAFDSAMAAYRDRRYADATRGWDALAADDVSSALWAARAVRDGNGGCAVAKDRFDQVALRAWGTTVGYDATLEGGQCYRAVGAIEAARAHFSRLIIVQAYAARAQSEIDTLSQGQVAARSQARPAPPPASKPKAPAQQQQRASPPATPPQAAPPQNATGF